jgi:hypothetical protein
MSDTSILEAALIGLQHQLAQVETNIADIHRQLGIRAPRVTPDEGAGPKPARKRRKLSAAARKSIVEAQRKRWAAYRAKKAKSGR